MNDIKNESKKKVTKKIIVEKKEPTRFSNLTIDTIRVLGVEMIEKANSGHPGIVLGAAPIMYALYKDHLVVDPENPLFFNRDRFVLSAGHGSALLYATMHLAGYKNVTIEDLKNFRQINSKTAGHPENILIDGIETTTGPLGQGIAIAVGMAIAETKLNTYFKKYKLIDNYTYCLFGDGCLQEGISYEALSLAGRYKLNKLIFLFDSNGIQLDGKVSDSTITDYKKYFESLGLSYIKVDNGNDYTSISAAIEAAKQSTEKPTVIEIKTHIGYGSCYQDSNKAHGSALNLDQVNELKNKLSYNNEAFEISKNAYTEFAGLQKRGKKAYELFVERLAKLSNDKAKYEEYRKLENKQLTFDKKWFNHLNFENEATRNISGIIVNEVAKYNPLLTLISADISGSTKIWVNGLEPYGPENRLGTNLNAGVREFAMTAINSGITSYGLKAISSTFLSFADYSRAAIRLAAISHNPIINVFSHDSITVGEDGPTHQPVEQLWGLRLIPHTTTFRPGNLQELIGAFDFAFKQDEMPVNIITSRLAFKQIKSPLEKTSRGGYIFYGNKVNDISLVATGSELPVALETAEILEKEYNVKCNIISMPSFELFIKQTKVYKESVIGNKPLIAIEFGTTIPWYRIADFAVGINRYGMSGKSDDVIKKLKLTPDEIALKIKNYLDNNVNKKFF